MRAPSWRRDRRSRSARWIRVVHSGTPHTECQTMPSRRESMVFCYLLLELSGRQWVNHLSMDQAVIAAVHLQRDVGLMQTNVDVLDQYTLSLQKAASRIIDNCLGPSKYPASDVEMGTLGPRIYRAAKQMERMGLWRPSLDPLRLH